MKRAILILAIPLALVFGFLIGYDVQSQEVRRQTEITTTVLKINEAYREKLDTAELEVNLVLDINQGIVPIKEGEAKMLELHEDMVQHNKYLEALNAELEAK